MIPDVLIDGHWRQRIQRGVDRILRAATVDREVHRDMAELDRVLRQKRGCRR